MIYVASGGAIGAVLRYLTSSFYKFYFPNFPIGTLFVNFLGCFLIGILASNLEKQGTSLELLEKQYKIYPELIVSTPTIPEKTQDFINDRSIDIEKI